MNIQSFKIENFKSIRSLEIEFDPEMSLLTGVNNSGKTTILEALALWVECFGLLVQAAKRSVQNKFYKGDYILGATNSHYVDFGILKSVQCPSFADMFYNRNTRNKIRLSAVLHNADKNLTQEIGFLITSSSQSRYAIKHDRENRFDYALFNRMFTCLPNSVGVYYSSPIANIVTSENFMTEPQINERLALKDSLSVMRNRLYNLYYQHSLFRQFEQDLSYILLGAETQAQIKFIPQSDINHDARVVINYTIKNDRVQKDLALLGSGSLQAIEILLNIYHRSDDKRDLYLILLDEPDSHIHRDIQKRLFEVLHRVTRDNQLVLTTHNEALIRSTPLHNLYHIDNTATGKVTCMSSADLNKLEIPHFKGLYPSALNPIIKSLNATAVGLDFVSAIEADLLVFVEGDDDARLLNYLFYQNVANKNKRIMFWVLGGVSKVFDSLNAYKLFFSEIQNKKSLWEKACLVFDQDRLIDEHKTILLNKLEDKMNIHSISLDVYTQEAVLLTDLSLLAQLIIKKYSLKNDINAIIDVLQGTLNEYKPVILARYKIDDAFVANYTGSYINKMNDIFKAGIKVRTIQLEHSLSEYYAKVPLFKLADKDDVAAVINATLQKIGSKSTYSTEDFYSLAQFTDANNNFQLWKQIIDFLTRCAAV